MSQPPFLLIYIGHISEVIITTWLEPTLMFVQWLTIYSCRFWADLHFDSMREIVQIFVSFSESLNFTHLVYITLNTTIDLINCTNGLLTSALKTLRPEYAVVHIVTRTFLRSQLYFCFVTAIAHWWSPAVCQKLCQSPISLLSFFCCLAMVYPAK